MLAREGISLAARVWRGFGHLGERGPEGGEKVMVIPGFLANDRTTMGLRRALADAGYRVAGWGLGLNTGVTEDTLDRIVGQVEAFATGSKVMLIGWSLGGIFAREAAKLRPDLVSKVVTLGSPFSGDPRANNAWRLYERVAGHAVDNPPIETDLEQKPPVPTLAVWSKRDGVVSIASARGEPGQSDAQIDIDSTHMGFGVSGRAYPKIVEAVKAF